VVWPAAASFTARLADRLVLPTPPLPDIMIYLRAVPAAISSNADWDSSGGASAAAAAAVTLLRGFRDCWWLLWLVLEYGYVCWLLLLLLLLLVVDEAWGCLPFPRLWKPGWGAAAAADTFRGTLDALGTLWSCCRGWLQWLLCRACACMDSRMHEWWERQAALQGPYWCCCPAYGVHCVRNMLHGMKAACMQPVMARLTETWQDLDRSKLLHAHTCGRILLSNV
jgi:hypothetical protein